MALSYLDKLTIAWLGPQPPDSLPRLSRLGFIAPSLGPLARAPIPCHTAGARKHTNKS